MPKPKLSDREASTLTMLNAWFGHRDERTAEAIDQVFRHDYAPDTGQTKPWVMPEWMKPYEDLIVNTGGNPVTELMNDHDTTIIENAPRAAIIMMVQSQVSLLTLLHREGWLK